MRLIVLSEILIENCDHFSSKCSDESKSETPKPDTKITNCLQNDLIRRIQEMYRFFQRLNSDGFDGVDGCSGGVQALSSLWN